MCANGLILEEAAIIERHATVVKSIVLSREACIANAHDELSILNEVLFLKLWSLEAFRCSLSTEESDSWMVLHLSTGDSLLLVSLEDLCCGVSDRIGSWDAAMVEGRVLLVRTWTLDVYVLEVLHPVCSKVHLSSPLIS